MSIKQFIFKLFRSKTDLELAVAELEEARKQKLQALTAREYSDAMVLYHSQRIDRLETYVETLGEQPKVFERIAHA